MCYIYENQLSVSPWKENSPIWFFLMLVTHYFFKKELDHNPNGVSFPPREPRLWWCLHDSCSLNPALKAAFPKKSSVCSPRSRPLRQARRKENPRKSWTIYGENRDSELWSPSCESKLVFISKSLHNSGSRERHFTCLSSKKSPWSPARLAFLGVQDGGGEGPKMRWGFLLTLGTEFSPQTLLHD